MVTRPWYYRLSLRANPQRYSWIDGRRGRARSPGIRHALGFPNSLHDELFGGSVGLARRQAANHPLEFSTPFYVEWDTARSLGMTVEQYRRDVSRREKRIQYYGRILAAEKEKHQYDKIKEEREAESNKAPPPVATRGGRY